MPVSSSEDFFLAVRLKGVRGLGSVEETLRERRSEKYLKGEEMKD